MKDAKRVRSEALLDAPKRFVHDVLVMPGGDEIDWYYLDSPSSVMILPVTTDGEVVFVNQYRYNLGKYTLELPAGMIDEDESAEQAAIRELREETGYGLTEVESPTSLGTFFALPSETNRNVHLQLFRPVERLIARAPRDAQVERHFDMNTVILPYMSALSQIGSRIEGIETIAALLLGKNALAADGRLELGGGE